MTNPQGTPVPRAPEPSGPDGSPAPAYERGGRPAGRLHHQPELGLGLPPAPTRAARRRARRRLRALRAWFFSSGCPDLLYAPAELRALVAEALALRP